MVAMVRADHHQESGVHHRADKALIDWARNILWTFDSDLDKPGNMNFKILRFRFHHDLAAMEA